MLRPVDAKADEPPSPSSDTAEISGTERFRAEAIGNNGSADEEIYGNDDDYFRFGNTLDATAVAPGIESGLRLDAALFHQAPDRGERAPGGDNTTLRYDNDLRLERLYGTFRMGDFSLTLGDFHVELGRGMALSLIAVDEIGEDNALRGAQVEYRIPRKVRAVLVGGVVNSSNEDPFTRQLLKDDPMDRLLGARVEWEVLDALGFGVHGVMVKPRFTQESQIPEERLFVDRAPGVGVLTGGGSAEAHLEGAHLYLEGNYQQHDNYRAVESVLDESGVAAFGEVAYDLTPFSIKGEGVYYRRWLMEGPYRGLANDVSLMRPISYNNLPTLEPSFVPLASIGNVFGGRLTGDVYIDRAGLQLTLKSGVLHYKGGLLPSGEWNDRPDTTVIHPMLTVREQFEGTDITATVEGGFRYETTRSPEIAGRDSGVLWHLKGHVVLPVRGPHRVEVSAEVRRHALEVTEGTDYWVTLETLGYQWTDLFGVTLAHEYSDERAVRTSLGGMLWPASHYARLRASAELPAPLEDLNIGLSIGSRRGDIRCAGGVCRRFPDTVGAGLEAVYRF